MTAVCVTIGLLAAAELVYLLLIRRQHLSICRQLRFIREKESRKRLEVNIEGFGEGKMAEEINETLNDVRQQKRAMHEREKLIADAYANLSHDIRTPLTSLDGYMQLLADAKTPEERERYTAVTRERIDTLKELLEDLFTYTKLKNEAYELELSPVSLRSVVSETVLSYYETWQQAGVTPEVSVSDEPLTVNGNETAVKRILHNLTKNAVLHGRNRLFISLAKDGDEAVITVANPVEHPEEVEIERVFEQFYTADRMHRQASSGLGMAIAKEMTERMKGTIRATLNGDTFAVTICIPLLSDKGNA